MIESFVHKPGKRWKHYFHLPSERPQVFPESGTQKLEFSNQGAPEPGSILRDGDKSETGVFAGKRSLSRSFSRKIQHKFIKISFAFVQKENFGTDQHGKVKLFGFYFNEFIEEISGFYRFI